MFAGEDETVTLICEDALTGVMIDRFGKEVDSVPADAGEARVHAVVMKSPAFFGWLAQFGSRVRVEKPTWLAHEYRDYLADIVTAYE